MAYLRALPLALLSLTVLGGTLYSVINHTYLDTSDPLLSNLPHPLQHQSIFAQKSNIFNVLFIKKAWGWTSIIFAAVWLTSPAHVRTRQAVYRWFAATLVWGAFAAWFFGPAVIERLAVASGGECVLQLPPDPTAGPNEPPTLLSVPLQYCYTRSTLSPHTHPSLFVTPDPALSNTALIDATWTGKPRLYRGHDVSGHIFLLTLSVLFLHDQLLPTWRLVSTPSASILHKAAVVAASALLALWLFMSFTTSVYWHTPFEKITGFALGLVGFILTELPFRLQQAQVAPSASLKTR